MRLLSLLLLLAASTLAEDVDGNRALESVKVLASDEFAGRKSGMESGRKAEDWVAARLREIGLEPGPNGSWFHEFKASVPTAGTVAELAVAGGAPAKYGRDFVTLSYGGTGEVEAEVVFVGYGIPDRGDYEGMDVRGKIALAVRGKPPNSAYEDERQIGFKSSTARDRGAVGFLLVEGDNAITGTIQEKFHRADLPGFWINRKTADALFAAAKQKNLKAQVEAQASGPKSFALEGVTVRMKSDAALLKDQPMRNVMALWPGETDEVVICGAHLDHLGSDPAGRIYNGADDNASGSAMLLEVARAVAKTGTRFRRGILFVWFAAEEQGLIGSSRFVDKPPLPLDRIAVMLNADMVGQGKPTIAIGGVGFYPREAKWLGDLKLEGIATRPGRGGGGSDHAPFWRAGVPAFGIHTQGPHPNYHQPKDDWQAIKPELLQLAGNAMRGLAEQAAASTRPFCRENRLAEFLWHQAPITVFSADAGSPAEFGIDFRVEWHTGTSDRLMNGLDQALEQAEAKGAKEGLYRPGDNVDQLARDLRPTKVLGASGFAACRVAGPARRLGATIFAPFVGKHATEYMKELDQLAAVARKKGLIISLIGAPDALDAKTAASLPGALIIEAARAQQWHEELRKRKEPWLAFYLLGPLTENKAPVHREVARDIVAAHKRFGPGHLLVSCGHPQDASYAAQAPTLHPGIVAALLEELDDKVERNTIRAILGGDFVNLLRKLKK